MPLNLKPRMKGRAALPLDATVVRELIPADLALLEVGRGHKPPLLKKVGDSHHWLARRLAGGTRPVEASMITGYSPSRISILQADPKFQELLKHYRANTDEIYADVHERMSSLSLEALEELRERLHEEPEKLSPMTLLEIVKTLADRTGYGPSSKSTVTTVNIDLAGRLDRARARVAETTQNRLGGPPDGYLPDPAPQHHSDQDARQRAPPKAPQRLGDEK